MSLQYRTTYTWDKALRLTRSRRVEIATDFHDQHDYTCNQRNQVTQIADSGNLGTPDATRSMVYAGTGEMTNVTDGTAAASDVIFDRARLVHEKNSGNTARYRWGLGMLTEWIKPDGSSRAAASLDGRGDVKKLVGTSTNQYEGTVYADRIVATEPLNTTVPTYNRIQGAAASGLWRLTTQLETYVTRNGTLLLASSALLACRAGVVAIVGGDGARQWKPPVPDDSKRRRVKRGKCPSRPNMTLVVDGGIWEVYDEFGHYRVDENCLYVPNKNKNGGPPPPKTDACLDALKQAMGGGPPKGGGSISVEEIIQALKKKGTEGKVVPAKTPNWVLHKNYPWLDLSATGIDKGHPKEFPTMETYVTKVKFQDPMLPWDPMPNKTVYTAASTNALNIPGINGVKWLIDVDKAKAGGATFYPEASVKALMSQHNFPGTPGYMGNAATYLKDPLGQHEVVFEGSIPAGAIDPFMMKFLHLGGKGLCFAGAAKSGFDLGYAGAESYDTADVLPFVKETNKQIFTWGGALLGAKIGAVAAAEAGPVGSFFGGLIGSLIGGFAGSELGDASFEGQMKLGQQASDSDSYYVPSPYGP